MTKAYGKRLEITLLGIIAGPTEDLRDVLLKRRPSVGRPDVVRRPRPNKSGRFGGSNEGC